MKIFRMFFFRNLFIPLFLLIPTVFIYSLSPWQSPAEEQWLHFVEADPGRPQLPEEINLGLLADRRHPDPLWASAVELCESAFESIGKGVVPEKLLLPDVRVPLSMEFRQVLSGPPGDYHPLYALPERDGNRLGIRLRISDEKSVRYGSIYLTLTDGSWFIDQWLLDLRGETGDSIP
jgi:hypothetical protein